MRKAPVGVALCVGLALSAAAPAKDEYSLRLCGQSGCKLVTDRIVAAALSQEVTDFGAFAPSRVASPYFSVQYVPKGGVPMLPTYRLPEAAIARTQTTSSPEVAQVFAMATAGIQPFSDGPERGSRWWPLALTTFIGLAAVLARRGLRSPRGSNGDRGAVHTPVSDGRHQRHS